jgi:uncharacterized protein HI_0431
MSLISLGTVTSLLETETGRDWSESELKESKDIQAELDVQWQVYRLLKECEKRDIELILDLKNEIRAEGISNIGIEFHQ